MYDYAHRMFISKIYEMLPKAKEPMKIPNKHNICTLDKYFIDISAMISKTVRFIIVDQIRKSKIKTNGYQF